MVLYSYGEPKQLKAVNQTGKNEVYSITRNFSSLAVCLCNCQIKICQYFFLAYISMVIPCWTVKFKSANIFAMGPTAKFNSCQYSNVVEVTTLKNPCPLYCVAHPQCWYPLPVEYHTRRWPGVRWCTCYFCKQVWVLRVWSKLGW